MSSKYRLATQRWTPTVFDDFRRCLHTTHANFRGLRNKPDNFKLFFGPITLRNKRHLPEHKRMLFKRFEKPNDMPDIEIHNYGCRGTGIRLPHRWKHIPETVPHLIVPPDMDTCELKPYVSYRTRQLNQDEFTSKDLFNAIYGRHILKAYRNGDKSANLVNVNTETTSEHEAKKTSQKDDCDYHRVVNEMSDSEFDRFCDVHGFKSKQELVSARLEAEQFYKSARQTGSDIFEGGVPRTRKWNIRYSYSYPNFER